MNSVIAVAIAAIFGLIGYGIINLNNSQDKTRQTTQHQLNLINYVPTSSDRNIPENSLHEIKWKGTESFKISTLNLKGNTKPIILHFWESWCNVCTSEFPHFNAFYQTYKNDYLFIPVSNDRKNGQGIQEFYNDNKLNDLPAFWDRDALLSKHFKVTGLPTTVFLKPTGEELGRVIGSLDWRKDYLKIIVFMNHFKS